LGFSETNKDTIKIKKNDAGFSEYTIDLSKNSAWNGRIEQLRLDPVSSVTSGTVEIQQIKLLTAVTAVNNENINLPRSYSLSQNYPNPFNPTTQIKYSVPQSGMVNISVYNILGQEVARLVNQVQKAGYYNITFDASKLASGVYLYKILSGNYSQTRKMMLLK
jgi:hypothetical protein